MMQMCRQHEYYKKSSYVAYWRRLISLLSSSALVVSSLPSHSFSQQLPQGASIQSGQVQISTSGNNMIISQGSDRAIVNWNSFSVGSTNSIEFAQPNQSSAILNRVTGETRSNIAGAIHANGQVFLVNPNGIAITATGSVRVDSGFVASTLDINDQDFLEGSTRFQGKGASAEVRNDGVIAVGRGGYAALLGGKVRNDGLIAVPYGKIGLGSGEQAVLDFSGDGFLQVAVPTAKGTEGGGSLIDSKGQISAEGGTVVIAAATARQAARNAVNLSGVVEATSVSGKNGSITIGGGLGGNVKVSGKLLTKSTTGKGGYVKVTGKSIQLTKATVDASGTKGGGTIKIGGDWQGSGQTQRADTLSVDKDSIIRSDATGTGDGGTVVLWSDQHTKFGGLITARGGENSGNGGNVEVSGKAILSFNGLVDLTAANGNFGSLLLDPDNVVISNASASGDDRIININTLLDQLDLAHVTVSAVGGGAGGQGGNISINSPLAWTSSNSLTLHAGGNISINSAVSWATNSTLTLQAAGNIYFNAPVTATGVGAGLVIAHGVGKDYFVYRPITLSGAGSKLKIGAAGDLKQYTLLHCMEEIESINSMGLGGYYALANSITAARSYTGAVVGTTLYDPGDPTMPIDPFSGIFAGLGNTISNLDIVRTIADGLAGPYQFYGLFGVSNGTIREITLDGGGVNVDLTGLDLDYAFIGAGQLVGYVTGGTIRNVYSTGTISISNVKTNASIGGLEVIAGGLVGYNEGGKIQNSYAKGELNIHHLKGYHRVSASVGGLVGANIKGSIEKSYAEGAVNVSNIESQDFREMRLLNPTLIVPMTTSIAQVNAGGLVGVNSDKIDIAYAKGKVNVSDINTLVELDPFDIWWDTDIYPEDDPAYLTFTADAFVGGLVGGQWNFWDTTQPMLTNAYARGDVEIKNVTSDHNRRVYGGGLIGDLVLGHVEATMALGSVKLNNLVDMPGRYPEMDEAILKTGRGGLVGKRETQQGKLLMSYFQKPDDDTLDGIGQGNLTGVDASTETQLKDPAYFQFNGWDFNTVWAPAGDGYHPELYALTPVLNVKVSDQSRTYGSTKPIDVEFLGGYREYVFGSNDALLPHTSSFLHTLATSASNAGQYQIDVRNAGTDWNGVTYRIITETDTATLTISKADLTITAKNDSRARSPSPYIGGNGLTFTGFKNGQTVDVLGGILNYSGSAQGAQEPGVYSIIPSGLTSLNYNISYVAGSLTIYPSSLSLNPPPTISPLIALLEPVHHNGNTYRHAYVDESKDVNSETLENLLLAQKACFSATGWSSCGDLD